MVRAYAAWRSRMGYPQQQGAQQQAIVPRAGMDAYGMARPGGPAVYTDQLPDIELEWRESEPNDPPETERFRYTINSWGAGGFTQRGGPEYLQNLSASTLVTHKGNRAILPWKTQSQTINLTNAVAGSGGLSGALLHATFKGRMVVAAYGYTNLYAETSPTDATLIPVLGFSSGILSLNKVTIAGTDYLAVGTMANLVIYIAELSTGSYNAITLIGSPRALVQVPLPKEPIVIRSAAIFYLVGSDSIPDVSTPAVPLGGHYYVLSIGGSPSGSSLVGNGFNNAYTAVSNQIVNTVQRPGFCVGVRGIGGLPTRIWWRDWEFPQHASAISGFLASTSLYGADYARHTNITLSNVQWAGFVGSYVVCGDGMQRVVAWDGEEFDTQIFKDVKPEAGYDYYAMGGATPHNQLIVHVNKVPTALADQDLSGTQGQLTVKHQLWRYEFGRGAYSPISAEKEWQPWPAAQGGATSKGTLVGHVSAYPATTMPYNEVTGRLWSFPGEISNVVYHKPQEGASIDPYGLRDTGFSDYESSGQADSIALLFPGDARDAAKVFTNIHYGGEDAGGTGSSVAWYIAEGGSLDDTRARLGHTFSKGFSLNERSQPLPANETPFLNPQARCVITQGTDADSTPQALPVSFEGYVTHDRRLMAKAREFG